MNEQIRYRPLNENTLLVSWPPAIDESIHEQITSFVKAIEDSRIVGVKSVYHAYHEVAITFDNDFTSHHDLSAKLQKLNFSRHQKTPIRTWTLPVCYDQRYGLDIDSLSQKLQISSEELIRRHSQPSYKIHFLGFLPGFMYLAGLDPTLHFPRKTNPAPTTKGSVAIGGTQTGIYPQNSPGGWHVIGSCPLTFFDSYQNPPCLFRAGDTVRFEPVSYQEYKVIELEARLEVFDYQQILKNG